MTHGRAASPHHQLTLKQKGLKNRAFCKMAAQDSLSLSLSSWAGSASEKHWLLRLQTEFQPPPPSLSLQQCSGWGLWIRTASPSGCLCGGGCPQPILVLDTSSGHWASGAETAPSSRHQEQNSEIPGPLMWMKPNLVKRQALGGCGMER